MAARVTGNGDSGWQEDLLRSKIHRKCQACLVLLTAPASHHPLPQCRLPTSAPCMETNWSTGLTYLNRAYNQPWHLRYGPHADKDLSTNKDETHSSYCLSLRTRMAKHVSRKFTTCVLYVKVNSRRVSLASGKKTKRKPRRKWCKIQETAVVELNLK